MLLHRIDSRGTLVSSSLLVPALLVLLLHLSSPSAESQETGTSTGAEKKGASVPPLPGYVLHGSPKPISPGAVTEDWTRFLGPGHDGVCNETKLLKDWGPNGPALLWEMSSEQGYASPVVLGDRLVHFHRVGDQEVVDCVHRETGKRFWTVSTPTNYRDRYGFGGGPRACPVLDGERVYTHGAQGILQCIDLATGKVLWWKNTSTDFEVPQDYFGVVSAPLVEGDLLLVNVGAPKGPCVVAFDKRTGEIVWKAGDQWGPSCAAPVPADLHGRRRILVFAGGDSRPPTGGLLSIDPKDGTIESRFPFRSKTYASVNASTPAVVGDKVYLSTSYRTGGVLLQLGSDGGVKELFRTESLRCHFMTPIHRDGFLYGVDGRGKQDIGLTCLDLATGKSRWRWSPEFEEEVMANGEKTKITLSTDLASMLFADDAFLCLGEYGHLLWLDLSPEGHEIISQARLFKATETWATPVISRGLLYVVQNNRDKIAKTNPRLLCYDLRASN